MIAERLFAVGEVFERDRYLIDDKEEAWRILNAKERQRAVDRVGIVQRF